jgi:hypothetical protein
MKTISRLVAGAVLAAALPMYAAAQSPTPDPTPAPAPAPAPADAPVTPDAKLQPGQWTGTVTPPDGGLFDLVFAVAQVGDSVKIDLSISEMAVTFPLSDIRLQGTSLSFRFLAEDDDITCKLEKKATGSYEGTCADATGGSGPMTMTPPKKGAGSTDHPSE